MFVKYPTLQIPIYCTDHPYLLAFQWLLLSRGSHYGRLAFQQVKCGCEWPVSLASWTQMLKQVGYPVYLQVWAPHRHSPCLKMGDSLTLTKQLLCHIITWYLVSVSGSVRVSLTYGHFLAVDSVRQVMRSGVGRQVWSYTPKWAPNTHSHSQPTIKLEELMDQMMLLILLTRLLALICTTKCFAISIFLKSSHFAAILHL